MFDIDFSNSLVDFSNFDISQLGNAFLFGGTVLLIGMATVFAVIFVLWICLKFFKFVFHDLGAKKASKKKLDSTPILHQAENVGAADDDEEIVAVIAAAIAMAESELSGSKFKVVSFRRV